MLSSGLVDLVILTLVNTAPDPAALVERVSDDPTHGPPGGVGLSAAVAIAIFETRTAHGSFADIEELFEVPGFSDEALHNLRFSMAALSPDERLAILLASASAEVLLEVVPGIDEPVHDSSDESLLEVVMRLRELGAFGSFELFAELADLPVQRAETLLEAFTPRDRSELDASTLRARVGVELARRLEAYPDTVSGNEPALVALSRLGAGGQEDEPDVIADLLDQIETSSAVHPEERVIDLIAVPEVTAARVGPPSDLPDPAEIPGLPKDYRWFKTPGAVLVSTGPKGRGRWLRPDGWSEPVSVPDLMLLKPTGGGVDVFVATRGRFRTAKRLLDAPVRALWLESTTGVGGGVAREASSFAPNTLIQPPNWSGPTWDPDIWVNPDPDVPWLGPYRPDGSEGGPKGVLVGGGLVAGGEGGIVVGWGGGFGGGAGDGGGAGNGGAGFGGFGLGAPVVAQPITISVRIAGCPCLRRGEVHEWRAIPAPPGGSFQWTVDDNTIADFVSPTTEAIVKLRGKKIGDVELTVDYTLGQLTTTATKSVAVLYSRFTNQSGAGDFSALALMDPAPLVTADPNSAVSRLKSVDPPNLSAIYELDFQGTLADALVDIRELVVRSQHGPRVVVPRTRGPHGEHDDDSYEALKVEVPGPGQSYVRILARNSVGNWGSATLMTTVRIPDNWVAHIVDAQRDLADAKVRGHQQWIDAASSRLQRAFQYGLEAARVEVGAMELVRGADPTIPGGEKWSIAVEDDVDSGVATIKTQPEQHDIDLKERRPLLLRPRRRPKKYFLLPDSYDADRLTFKDDGRILCEREDVIGLFYYDSCCTHAVPDVRVTMDPVGQHLIKKDEPVTLRAQGYPESVGGVPGEYSWSVVAAPKDATYRFEPDGSTPSKVVEFFTDTQGVYTFRVDYSVAGITSSWTYAVGDGQIIRRIDLEVAVKRTGDYSGEAAPSQDRPYYRERVATAQRGAEVEITNMEGGDLGQDFKVEVRTRSELAFHPGMALRLKYTDDTTADRAFMLDPDLAFLASVEVRAPKPVGSAHIIRIGYDHTYRNHGDAVWLEVRAEPLLPTLVDLDDIGGSPPEPPPGVLGSSNVAVVAGDPIGLTPGDPDESWVRVVNLILRARDLGRAGATRALAGVSPFPIHATLVNGNVFVERPLFSVSGNVELPAVLNFNSLSATRARAIREYGATNGKDAPRLAEEFGPELWGDGWTCSLTPTLFTYVDPEGDEPEAPLKFCLEIQTPDGNRVAFDRQGSSEYLVRSLAEADDNDPDGALRWIVKRTNEGWRWELNRFDVITFDTSGMLSGGSQEGEPRLTTTVAHSQDATTLTLTGGRSVRLDREQGSGRYSAVVDPLEKSWGVGRVGFELREIASPLHKKWKFEYQGDGLLDRISPPIGHELDFRYYLGATTTVGVAADIARDFWGRCGRIEFGERILRIRYEGRAANQVVTTEDPMGHFRRYEYLIERQAAHKIEYSNYWAPQEWKRMLVTEFRSDSKAPEAVTDYRGSTRRTGYRSGRGRSSLPHAKYHPNGESVTFRYKEGILDSVTDEARAERKYIMDSEGRLERIEYQRMQTLGVDGQNISFQPVERFIRDPQKRVIESVDIDGSSTRSGYGGPGDLHQTERPTSRTVGSLTTRFEYDKMGRLEATTSSRGIRTVYGYDDDGRLETETVGSDVTTYTYDDLDRLTNTEDRTKRTTSVEFDDYGDPVESTNVLGHVRKIAFDKNGKPELITEKDTAEHRFEEHDALGRWRRWRTPEVYRQGPEPGLASAEVLDVTVEFDDEPKPFALAGGVLTTKTIYKSGPDGSQPDPRRTYRTIYADLRGYVLAEEHQIGDLQPHIIKKTTVIRRDRRGDVERVEEYAGVQLVSTTLSLERDPLGRVTASEQGSVRSRHGRGRDANGIFETLLLPRQSRQDGADPLRVTRFDDLGRLTSVVEAGQEIMKYEFEDDNALVKVHGPDPSSAAGLVHLLTVAYDAHGRIKREETQPRGLPAAQWIEYHYDDVGRVEKVERSTGVTDEFDYYDDNRVKQSRVIVPGAVAGTPSSGVSEDTPSTQSQTFKTDFTYDEMGRPTSVVTSAGSGYRVDYDLMGRVETFTQLGVGTGGDVSEQRMYDRHGELRARYWGPEDYWLYRSGRTEDEEVRRSGEKLYTRTIRKDAGGGISEVASDWNVVTELLSRYPSGRLKSYEVKTPDRAGQLQKRTRVEWKYGRGWAPNSIDVEHAGASGRHVEFGYDPRLRKTIVSDSLVAGGLEYELGYNSAGHLTRIRRPAGEVADSTFTWHRHGGLHELTHKLGEDWDDKYTSTAEEGDFAATGQGKSRTHEHSLWDLDALTGEGHYDSNFASAEAHEFDAVGRLTSTEVTGQIGSVVDSALLGFAVFGVIGAVVAGGTAITASAHKRRFFYDEQNRRVYEIDVFTPDKGDEDEKKVATVRMTYGAGPAIKELYRQWTEVDETQVRTEKSSYEYDDHGRVIAIVTERDHRAAGGGRWIRELALEYAIDDKPVRTRLSELRDSGRALIEESWLNYNMWGQLIRSRRIAYERPEFAVEGVRGTALSVVVDVVDLLASFKRPFNPTAPLEDEIRYYTYDGGDLIAVTDGKGKLKEAYSVAAGYNHRLAVHYKPEDESSFVDANYHYDHRGSSLVLTRQDGEILEEFAQSGTKDSHKYRSSRYIEAGMWTTAAAPFFETAARSYDADAGQFLSADPLGLTGGDNTYAFGGFNPVAFGDPNGLMPLPALAVFAIAVAANAALDIAIDFAMSRVFRTRFQPGRSILENVTINVVTGGTGLGRLAKLRHAPRFIKTLARLSQTERRVLAVAAETGILGASEAWLGGGHYGQVMALSSMGNAAFIGAGKAFTRDLKYGGMARDTMTLNAKRKSLGFSEVDIHDAQRVVREIDEHSPRLAEEMGVDAAVHVRDGKRTVQLPFGDEFPESGARILDTMPEVAATHQIIMDEFARIIRRAILGDISWGGTTVDFLRGRNSKMFGNAVHNAMEKSGIKQIIKDCTGGQIHLDSSQWTKGTKLRPDIVVEFADGRKVVWDFTTFLQMGKAPAKYNGIDDAVQIIIEPLYSSSYWMAKFGAYAS